MSLFSPDQPHFIRGVNLGGWLTMERYITPYSFAVTDCHQRGDFCWYPGQIDAPPHSNLCNLTECQAVLSSNVFGNTDYPMDEWNLNAAFENKTIGADWLNYHFDNFLQKKDLEELKAAGITHVRVPLPHWILGNIDHRYGEPWIAADRWKYFLRMVGWAREIGLEVWPNLHTAPGSQNGFDNSGQQNSVFTCGGWTDNPKAIQRTLNIIKEIALAIKEADILDVVTGFGLLNEPFGDCSFHKYKMFLHDGKTIVRDILGEGIGIYMSDMFQAHLFNDGQWGLDAEWNNTFLDSHYYNIFSDKLRTFSPKQHIEHICHGHSDSGESVRDCCFENPPVNTAPSHGVQRIVAEWSAAFDAMPGEVLKIIMKGIHEYGVAPLLNRTISQERKDFLTNIIEAQIVSYEAADTGVAHGWFYWNFKMEGGAYIEWDMLRGIREGWFPEIAAPDVPSFTLYGTCDEIESRTNNSTKIVHTYPWGDPAYWRGPLVNQSDIIKGPQDTSHRYRPEHRAFTGLFSQIMFVAGAFLLFFGIREYYNHRRMRKGYIEIQS